MQALGVRVFKGLNMSLASLRNRVVIEFTDSFIPPFVCGDGVTPYEASIIMNHAQKLMSDHLSKLRTEQWIAKCKEIVRGGTEIKKEKGTMCECRTVAEFTIEGKKFSVEYNSHAKELDINLRNIDSMHKVLLDVVNIEDELKLELEPSSRSGLIEIIQGLDDKEIERLVGYLEGWRDSDDE